MMVAWRVYIFSPFSTFCLLNCVAPAHSVTNQNQKGAIDGYIKVSEIAAAQNQTPQQWIEQLQQLDLEMEKRRRSIC